MVYPILKISLFPTLRLFLRKVEGIKNVPKDRAFIIAANHESYLDPFLIIAIVSPLLNKKIHFVANRGRFWNKFGDKISHDWAGCIPLDKGKEHIAMNEIKVLLKKGGIVGIFPGGPRSLDGNIKQGKTGLIRIALNAKVPILPIGLKGTFDIAPRDKLIPKFKRADMKIGKPVYLDKYYYKQIKYELLNRLTKNIMLNIAELAGKEHLY